MNSFSQQSFSRPIRRMADIRRPSRRAPSPISNEPPLVEKSSERVFFERPHTQKEKNISSFQFEPKKEISVEGKFEEEFEGKFEGECDSTFHQPSFVDRVPSWWFSCASLISSLTEPFRSRRFWLFSVGSLFLIALFFFGAKIFDRGMDMKGEVLGESVSGYEELSAAVEAAKTRDFVSSGESFRNAFVSFSAAANAFDSWNGTLIEVTRFLPVISLVSSGKYAVDAAKNISAAGELLSKIGNALSALGNPLDSKEVSFLGVFASVRGDMERAESLLSMAMESLEKVSIGDLPEEKRGAFLELKSRLPEAVSGIRLFLNHGDVFVDMLGGNGPRKFLFLFQNNQEMRATGGFIGSYAFLEMNSGNIRKFFVDGIFNPDGQIHEDIVPPVPLQKVSAGWSLHDSNWFPDFPMSAEKAIHFYEKTGGPTVDGVITFTPEVLRRFLAITGPITLEQYGMTIDEQNFLESIQYQVEVAYNREENRPKQILSDLAPIILERVFGKQAMAGALEKTLSVIESGLSEKHILFYSRNREMEQLISGAGWSGEVLSARRDYASVIHSNINGYKTDGILDETISHRAEIQDDGSVIDTIVVQRVHRGGNTGYEWWDKVNADYMRVYVPLGSTLLSAEGYTRETVDPPLLYDALHFSRDPDVLREEEGLRLDPVSGTRISEDAQKTVFGNWVYVSPGETVEVTYRYLLPFRVNPENTKTGLDSYSLVFQKQSGSRGSVLLSKVIFPNRFRSIWQSDKNLIPCDGGVCLETDLKFDRFFGILFSDRL